MRLREKCIDAGGEIELTRPKFPAALVRPLSRNKHTVL